MRMIITKKPEKFHIPKMEKKNPVLLNTGPILSDQLI